MHGLFSKDTTHFSRAVWTLFSDIVQIYNFLSLFALNSNRKSHNFVNVGNLTSRLYLWAKNVFCKHAGKWINTTSLRHVFKG